MKKLFSVLLLFIVVFTLSACNEEAIEEGNWVILPNLNGYNETEVSERLDSLDISYVFEYETETVSGYETMFIMYTSHAIGDLINTSTEVTILVYPPKEIIYITLPDIAGKLYSEAVTLLSAAGLYFSKNAVVTIDALLDNQVIGYLDYEAGYQYGESSALKINVYTYVNPSTEYFEPIDLEYDGPYLDESFSSINYLDPRGGYFEVTMTSCTDGDTGRFHYPTDIYNAIQSSAKSVRFLNMDTEETYPGGEEEWGKPASVYTCDLLNAATSIIIQTDPNSGLLDTHGRLLGWIWIKQEGETEYFLLNYMVVRQGLAQVKYEFGAGETISYGDLTYQEWMHKAEDYAILNKLGQWGNLLDYYWDYDNDEPDKSRWY